MTCPDAYLEQSKSNQVCGAGVRMSNSLSDEAQRLAKWGKPRESDLRSAV